MSDPKNNRKKEVVCPRTFSNSISRLHATGWYWGPLSWAQAESLLKNQELGTFLLRDSADARYIFALSFAGEQRVHHVRIKYFKGKFSFGRSEPSLIQSSDIVELIESTIQFSVAGKFSFFLHPREYGHNLPPPVVNHQGLNPNIPNGDQQNPQAFAQNGAAVNNGNFNVNGDNNNNHNNNGNNNEGNALNNINNNADANGLQLMNLPGGSDTEAVHLKRPLSRFLHFKSVFSLRHLARYAIRTRVRADLIPDLPLPSWALDYLTQPQYFFEDPDETTWRQCKSPDMYTSLVTDLLAAAESYDAEVDTPNNTVGEDSILNGDS